MRPPRNVPVVSTTARAVKRMPVIVVTPVTRPLSIDRSAASCWNTDRFGSFSTRARMARRYSARSACARVARTAGPLLAFSVRNWMPPRSAAQAIAPPIASISRTRWPLPMPPMAGLQLIAPTVSTLCVSSSVRAPRRAEASAASTPAWPPPITITSKVAAAFMEAGRIPQEAPGPFVRAGVNAMVRPVRTVIAALIVGLATFSSNASAGPVFSPCQLEHPQGILAVAADCTTVVGPRGLHQSHRPADRALRRARAGAEPAQAARSARHPRRRPGPRRERVLSGHRAEPRARAPRSRHPRHRPARHRPVQSPQLRVRRAEDVGGERGRDRARDGCVPHAAESRRTTSRSSPRASR